MSARILSPSQCIIYNICNTSILVLATVLCSSIISVMEANSFSWLEKLGSV